MTRDEREDLRLRTLADDRRRELGEAPAPMDEAPAQVRLPVGPRAPLYVCDPCNLGWSGGDGRCPLCDATGTRLP